MDVFQTMIVHVRMKVKDTAMRIFRDPEIIASINEGKNELVKIIRQANEEFFETSTTGTISSAGSAVKRAGLTKVAEESATVANCVPPIPAAEADEIPKVFHVRRGASSSYWPISS